MHMKQNLNPHQTDLDRNSILIWILYQYKIKTIQSKSRSQSNLTYPYKHMYIFHPSDLPNLSKNPSSNHISICHPIHVFNSLNLNFTV